jgi:hypothetical protein
MLGLCAGLAAACGDAPPDFPDAGSMDAGPPSLLPTKVGNQWTYRVTKGNGSVVTKVQTVTATLSVNGQTGFLFTTDQDGVLNDESVQTVDGTRHLRVSELAYDNAGVLKERFQYEPPALRVDSGRTSAGTRFTDVHTKSTFDPNGTLLLAEARTHEFIIEAENELIEVAAGSFKCVRIRRSRSGNDAEKTYWYSPGVGKVKELGGQTEELTSYSVLP